MAGVGNAAAKAGCHNYELELDGDGPLSTTQSHFFARDSGKYGSLLRIRSYSRVVCILAY